MLPRTRDRLATAWLPVCVMLAGCGGSTSPPAPPPPGIVFPVAFALTGSFSASGTFTDTSSANLTTSCAEFGSTGIHLGTYFIPSPPHGMKLQRQAFHYESLVSPYHGPGDYTDVRDLVEITAGDGTYQGGTDATLTLTSRADGSGSVTFQKFTDVTDSSRRLTGKIDWTCARAS